MMARTAARMRAHLEHFSATLAAGLCQPARRFVAEALYGIAARQSVRLTEIGRALEEPIALAKTETRLSRNLGRPELGDHVGQAVLREGSSKVRERTLLILDVSDIAKRYAEKMDYLARVRDGSTGEIVDGYWLCQVVAVENEETAIVPLVSTLYSQAAPDFVSENAELKAAMAAVSEACEGRGVWVVDRGGDRGALYADLLAAGRSFVIRQKGDRHLRWGLRTIETARLAADCPLSHATHIVRQEHGQEVRCRPDYGCRPVRLPEHPDQSLWLVVVRGLGAAPMMLLTAICPCAGTSRCCGGWCPPT
jgi:hypothetical protein